jgi:hypothetical protein
LRTRKRSSSARLSRAALLPVLPCLHARAEKLQASLCSAPASIPRFLQSSCCFPDHSGPGCNTRVCRKESRSALREGALMKAFQPRTRIRPFASKQAHSQIPLCLPRAGTPKGASTRSAEGNLCTQRVQAGQHRRKPHCIIRRVTPYLRYSLRQQRGSDSTNPRAKAELGYPRVHAGQHR